MSNHPDTYDSLHATDLALDVVSIASVHANISFEVLAIYALHLFSGKPLLWSCGSYAYINFKELLWNYKFIITKIYFH